MSYKKVLRLNRITVTISCVLGTLLLFGSVVAGQIALKYLMLSTATFAGVLSGFLSWLNNDLVAQETLEKLFIKDTQAMSVSARAALESEKQRLETARKLEELLNRKS